MSACTHWTNYMHFIFFCFFLFDASSIAKPVYFFCSVSHHEHYRCSSKRVRFWFISSIRNAITLNFFLLSQTFLLVDVEHGGLVCGILENRRPRFPSTPKFRYTQQQLEYLENISYFSMLHEKRNEFSSTNLRYQCLKNFMFRIALSMGCNRLPRNNHLKTHLILPCGNENNELFCFCRKNVLFCREKHWNSLFFSTFLH